MSQLAELGQGIVIQSDFIAEEALRRGTLVPVLQEYSIDQMEVYALYPCKQYLPLKIARSIDHLKFALAEELLTEFDRHTAAQYLPIKNTYLTKIRG